jgi:hypothetical protein
MGGRGNSVNTIRVINSRRRRWVGHVERIRAITNGNTEFWVEHEEERDHLEDLSVDGRTISEQRVTM